MNGPVEPPAHLRQGARELYVMFCALTQEGFTEAQALEIIGHVLKAHERTDSNE